MKKKFLFWKEIHTLKMYKAYWNLNQEMLMKLHVYGTKNLLLKFANRHFFSCDVCIFVLLFYICLKWLCGKASQAKSSRAELLDLHAQSIFTISNNQKNNIKMNTNLTRESI